MKAFATTFSDFFNYSLHKDNFATILEMARAGAGTEGDIVKKPVPFDAESINFLKQFPHEYWPQAAQKRMEMLHDKLIELHKERESHGYKSLEEAIENALKTKNYSDLTNWQGPKGLKLSQEYIDNEIKLSNCDRLQDDPNKDAYVKAEANKLAFEFIKSQVEHIPEDNKPVTFSFKGQGNYAKTTTIDAIPYLNRLYHKLERTEGEEHDPKSGLEGVGQFGFDLSHPNIDATTDPENPQAITRGLRWPQKSEKQINDLFVFNSNHMFGNLRQKFANAIWLAVKNSAGRPREDTFALDEMKLKLEKEITKEFKRDKKFNTNDALRKAVTQEVNKRVNLMIHDGKLSAMPIPGRPDLDRKYHLMPSNIRNDVSAAYKTLGLSPGASDDDIQAAYNKAKEQQASIPGSRTEVPQKIKTAVDILRNTNRSINRDDIDGTEKTINPVLYLPHEKQQIIKNGEKKEEYVPLIMPSHYFRALGSEIWDLKKDENGQTLKDIKTHGHKVPQEMLRGPNNDYVYLHAYPSESDPTRPWFKIGAEGRPETNLGGHRSQGGYLFNKDDVKKVFLSPCDKNYDIYYSKVFDKQKTKDLNGNKLYSDFENGILLCARSGGKCGGATNLEINEILANVDIIHNIVFFQALKSLADQRLWTSKGRVEFAFKITTNYAQLDLGGGSRRRRILNAVARNQSMDKENKTQKGVTGEEMASNQSKDAERRLAQIDLKLARGEKKRGVSSLEAPRTYSLQAIQDTINELEKEAPTIDAAKNANISSVDVEKLTELIKDKAAVLSAIRDILIRVFVQEGSTSPAEIADQWIREKINEGKTDAVQLISELKSDPRVARIIGTEISAMMPTANIDKLSSEDQARIATEVQDVLDTLRERDVNDDQIRSNLDNVTNTVLQKLQIDTSNSKYVLYKDAIEKDLQNRFSISASPKSSAGSTVRPGGLRNFMARQMPIASEQPTSAPHPDTSHLDMNQLIKDKEWIKLSHHQNFLRHQGPNAVNLKNKLINHFEQNPDKFDPIHRVSALQNLRNATQTGE